MYIDPSDPKRTMDQEVNEATAQLKGLLGIGAGEKAVAAPKQQQPADQSGTAAHGGKPPKNKRNRKKQNNKQRGGDGEKEGNQTLAQNPKQQQQQNLSQSQGRSSKDGNRKDGNKADGAKADGGGNKKGKNNKKNSKKNSKGNDNKNEAHQNQGNEPDGANNFAWSAFQSSPDASKLPIPAFTSPLIVKDEVAVSDAAAEKHAEETLAALLPVPSTGSNNPTSPNNAAAGNTDTSNAPVEKNEDGKESEPMPPPSKTGINLAALTSGGAKTAGAPGPNPTPTLQQQQQQPQNMPVSRGPQPHMQPHMNYQYHHGHNPYHHMSMPYHQPPPGYMTIQVQVPPVLMPNRQMVVSSPSGYPVQVVVPEGIPPGMVIPVHVPAAAPPLHMMSPEQQRRQQQQAYQQQQRTQQQGYYHHQPGR